MSRDIPSEHDNNTAITISIIAIIISLMAVVVILMLTGCQNDQGGIQPITPLEPKVESQCPE